MHVFTMKDAIVDSEGNIKYEERQRCEQEIKYYQDLSRGLYFVN